MADDRDIIIGELREGFRQMMLRFQRQDEISIVRDQQTEAHKNETRQQIEAYHKENQAALRDVIENATRISGRSYVAYNWVNDHGKDLIIKHAALEIRVKNLEDVGISQNGESRGKKIAYSMVGSAIGIVFTAFTAMTAEVLDNIKKLLHISGGP